MFVSQEILIENYSLMIGSSSKLIKIGSLLLLTYP